MSELQLETKTKQKTLLKKLESIIKAFEKNFKEREEVIRGSLLAILAKEHVLLLGPPGTAKSYLANEMCGLLEHGNFFSYLVTSFTVPEELFGPISLKALEEDRFSRNIDKYLPTAKIAFLDEIFKSNSFILNSLLSIINERIFHNGSSVIDVPLISVFGASNELPSERDSEKLDALYDRFLFRYNVEYIRNKSNFLSVALEQSENFESPEKITRQEIDQIHDNSKKIKFSEEAKKIFAKLRDKLRVDHKISISDRRWKKIADVLKVAAATTGVDVVDELMLILCKDMLWNKPEQQVALENAIIELIVGLGSNFSELEGRSSAILEELNAHLTSDRRADLLNVKVTCINDGKDNFSTLGQLRYFVRKKKDGQYYCECSASEFYDEEIIEHILKEHNTSILNRNNPKVVTLQKEFQSVNRIFSNFNLRVENITALLKDKKLKNIWISKETASKIQKEMKKTNLNERESIEKNLKELQMILEALN